MVPSMVFNFAKRTLPSGSPLISCRKLTKADLSCSMSHDTVPNSDDIVLPCRNAVPGLAQAMGLLDDHSVFNHIGWIVSNVSKPSTGILPEIERLVITLRKWHFHSAFLWTFLGSMASILALLLSGPSCLLRLPFGKPGLDGAPVSFHFSFSGLAEGQAPSRRPKADPNPNQPINSQLKVGQLYLKPPKTGFWGNLLNLVASC